MLIFPFLIGEGVSLKRDLIKPVRSVEIIYGQVRKPTYVKITYDTGIYLFFSVKMNDVRERHEIGSFVIESSIDENRLKNRFLFRFDEFYIKSCSKMVYVDDWGRAECGLKFESLDGEEFYLVSGDYPYSLALVGSRFGRLGLVPEYPLSEYRYEEICRN